MSRLGTHTSISAAHCGLLCLSDLRGTSDRHCGTGLVRRPLIRASDSFRRNRRCTDASEGRGNGLFLAVEAVVAFTAGAAVATVAAAWKAGAMVAGVAVEAGVAGVAVEAAVANDRSSDDTLLPIGAGRPGVAAAAVEAAVATACASATRALYSTARLDEAPWLPRYHDDGFQLVVEYRLIFHASARRDVGGDNWEVQESNPKREGGVSKMNGLYIAYSQPRKKVGGWCSRETHRSHTLILPLCVCVLKTQQRTLIGPDHRQDEQAECTIVPHSRAAAPTSCDVKVGDGPLVNPSVRTSVGRSCATFIRSTF